MNFKTPLDQMDKQELQNALKEAANVREMVQNFLLDLGYKFEEDDLRLFILNIQISFFNLLLENHGIDNVYHSMLGRLIIDGTNFLKEYVTIDELKGK